MTGITELSTLLRNLSPVADDDVYVFVSVVPESVTPDLLHNAKGMFKEREGVTFILEVSLAREMGLKFSGEYRCISCEVHSSLDAVGMTAAMSSALTKANISANVVAAYYHDHLFIQAGKVNAALSVLKSLADSPQ